MTFILGLIASLFLSIEIVKKLYEHFLLLGTSAEGVMSLPPSVRPSVCLSVCPLLACLRDNSSHIQPLGTKFAPIMHLVNLQAAFENGVD